MIRIIPCLNKQQKLYNLLKGQILGAFVGLYCGAVINGFLAAIVVGAIGFMIGGWLENQWFRGKLQRWLYWALPLKVIWGDKYLPDSTMLFEC